MAESSGLTQERAERNRIRINYWNVEEDITLSRLVNQHGPHDWNFIAQHLQGRSGKSCRLRWRNHLDPTLTRTPFTREENERLLEARQIYGSRWANIALLFKGRTDNALKNQWHVLMARKRREAKQIQMEELIIVADTSSSSNSVPHQNGAGLHHTPLASMGTHGWMSSLKFGFVPSYSNNFSGLNSAWEEGNGHSGAVNLAGNGRMKRSFFENSVTDLGGSSSSQADVESDGSGTKEVPFFDFLGVGNK